MKAIPLDGAAQSGAATRWFWPGMILISCLAQGAVLLVPALGPARPLVTFWFLLICPGLPFVYMLSLSRPLDYWVLGLGLSLALDAAVAMLMVAAGAWSPVAGVFALMGLSLLGTALSVSVAWLRRARAQRPRVRPPAAVEVLEEVIESTRPAPVVSPPSR